MFLPWVMEMEGGTLVDIRTILAQKVPRRPLQNRNIPLAFSVRMAPRESLAASGKDYFFGNRILPCSSSRSISAWPIMRSPAPISIGATVVSAP